MRVRRYQITLNYKRKANARITTNTAFEFTHCLSLRRSSLKYWFKMKILKNYQKTIFGVKYKLFTVIFNDKTKQYCYYMNALGTSNVGDCCIYKSKSKSKIFNKHTLTIIGLFSLFTLTHSNGYLQLFQPHSGCILTDVETLYETGHGRIMSDFSTGQILFW